MLASFGGRHIDNLTWTTFDHDVTVFAQSRTLHREGGGGAGISGLKGDLMLLNITKKERVSRYMELTVATQNRVCIGCAKWGTVGQRRKTYSVLGGHSGITRVLSDEIEMDTESPRKWERND